MASFPLQESIAQRSAISCTFPKSPLFQFWPADAFQLIVLHYAGERLDFWGIQKNLLNPKLISSDFLRISFIEFFFYLFLNV